MTRKTKMLNQFETAEYDVVTAGKVHLVTRHCGRQQEGGQRI